jgi:hypothetical protein
MWYHPKYYEELRKKRKELERQAQATSMRKHQATSIKRQATSNKRLSNKRIKIHEAWALANGYKHQATCDKLSRDKMTQGR